MIPNLTFHKIMINLLITVPEISEIKKTYQVTKIKIKVNKMAKNHKQKFNKRLLTCLMKCND